MFGLECMQEAAKSSSLIEPRLKVKFIKSTIKPFLMYGSEKSLKTRQFIPGFLEGL